MQIYPADIKSEVDALVERWWESDEGLGLQEYVERHCSKKVRRWHAWYAKQKELAEKEGAILN